MSEIDDGGPAFPQDLQGRRGDNPEYQGMSLRDYFAARFMDRACCMSQNKDGEWDYDNVAQCAYAQADAMLNARKP